MNREDFDNLILDTMIKNDDVFGPMNDIIAWLSNIKNEEEYSIAIPKLREQFDCLLSKVGILKEALSRLNITKSEINNDVMKKFEAIDTKLVDFNVIEKSQSQNILSNSIDDMVYKSMGQADVTMKDMSAHTILTKLYDKFRQEYTSNPIHGVDYSTSAIDNYSRDMRDIKNSLDGDLDREKLRFIHNFTTIHDNLSRRLEETKKCVEIVQNNIFIIDGVVNGYIKGVHMI